MMQLPPPPPAVEAPAPAPSVATTDQVRVAAALTNAEVRVDSSFRGASIVLYGAVFNPTDTPADVVVVVRGPDGPVRLVKKTRNTGVWLNSRPVLFEGAPGFYMTATSRPLSDIADFGQLRREGIGLDCELVLYTRGIAGRIRTSSGRMGGRQVRGDVQVDMERSGDGTEFYITVLSDKHVDVADLAPEAVETADALALCNAVRGILPVAALGVRAWPSSAATEGLRAELAKAHPGFAREQR